MRRRPPAWAPADEPHSEYNAWRKQSLRDFSWIWTRDPGIVDAPLSAEGREQVAALRARVAELGLDDSVELVVSSPLTRALQTAEGGFARRPILVTALHRERLDTWCDVGATRAALLAEWGEERVDLSELGEEVWWFGSRTAPDDGHEGPWEREPAEQLRQRLADFRRWLAARPEATIAVVGHSAFFKALLKHWTKLPNCGICRVALGGEGEVLGSEVL